MKIFSLQSKIGLVGWSLVLGSLAYFIDEGLFFGAEMSHCTSTLNDYVCSKDVASYYLLFFQNEYFNTAFWISVVFIILFIIRYFRNRNRKMTLKQN
jgi:hypothetical protein